MGISKFTSPTEFSPLNHESVFLIDSAISTWNISMNRNRNIPNLHISKQISFFYSILSKQHLQLPICSGQKSWCHLTVCQNIMLIYLQNVFRPQPLIIFTSTIWFKPPPFTLGLVSLLWLLGFICIPSKWSFKEIRLSASIVHTLPISFRKTTQILISNTYRSMGSFWYILFFCLFVSCFDFSYHCNCFSFYSNSGLPQRKICILRDKQPNCRVGFFKNCVTCHIFLWTCQLQGQKTSWIFATVTSLKGIRNFPGASYTVKCLGFKELATFTSISQSFKKVFSGHLA